MTFTINPTLNRPALQPPKCIAHLSHAHGQRSATYQPAASSTCHALHAAPQPCTPGMDIRGAINATRAVPCGTPALCAAAPAVPLARLLAPPSRPDHRMGSLAASRLSRAPPAKRKSSLLFPLCRVRLRCAGRRDGKGWQRRRQLDCLCAGSCTPLNVCPRQRCLYSTMQTRRQRAEHGLTCVSRAVCRPLLTMAPCGHGGTHQRVAKLSVQSSLSRAIHLPPLSFTLSLSLSLSLGVCVCVCVCVRARACLRAPACVQCTRTNSNVCVCYSIALDTLKAISSASIF